MLARFRCYWPEDPVPEDCPLEVFYEVKRDRDVVTRMVEVFVCGQAVRNSMALAEREGFDARAPEYRSLVHGPFLQADPERYDGDPLEEITETDFESAWNRATDKPWP